MKFKYIIAALALSLAVACQQEPVGFLSEIQVSESYVSIDVNGGSSSIDLTAGDAWQVDPASVPDWLTVSPMSGSAGSGKISFTAAATASTNTAEIKIQCGGQTQFINVIQFAEKADPVVMTVSEALALIATVDKGDGQSYNLDGEYYVKGIVCRIDEISTSYGNATFYLSDDGTFSDGKWLEVYRGYWLDNTKFATGDEIAMGDELTICGELMSYKGTPETVQNTAYVVSATKSLLSITPSEFDVDKEETTLVAKVVYSGDALNFESDSDWLNIAGMNTIADTTLVSIHVAANTGDSRTGIITLSSSKGGTTSLVTVTVNQAPGFAAFPLPFEESFLGSMGAWETVDVVPVENVNSIWTNDAKYGMKATATKKIVSRAELVSPNIDLTGVSSAVLNFEHAQKFAGNVNEEFTLYASVDNGETWTQLQIPAYPDGSSWDFLPSGEISLNRFVGNLVKIKFVYLSNEKFYGTWEIKNLQITEGNAAIANIASLNNTATTTEAAWTGTFTDAVVTYVNGNNAFIEDATAGVQLYLNGHGLTAGTKINGSVSGKIKLYNGYAELTALDFSAAEVTEGEVPAPTVLTLGELLASYLRWQNCQVKLEGVTFTTALSESNRNGKITQGDDEIAAYSQVNGKVIMSGTGDLVCWPVRYNANLQVGCWDSAHFTAEQ